MNYLDEQSQMTTSIHPFSDVHVQAKTLGCQDPQMYALLPRGFEFATSKDELLQEGNADTVRTLLRNAKLTETPLEAPGERFPSIQENDFTWVGPTLFVSASLLSENPIFVNIALNIVSTYLTDFFKGIAGSRSVTFDVVLEKTRTKKCVRIHYDGTAEDFAQFANTVDGVLNSES